MEALSQNPLIVSVVSLVIGVLLTTIVNRLRNKSHVITFTNLSNRIGVSADDDVFGNVRVQWKETPVRNLWVHTVELENSTTTDLADVDLHFHAESGTFILSERAVVVGQPRPLDWSPIFAARMELNGDKPSESQTREYFSNREYRVPVFNRSQRINVALLCTHANDDSPPNIDISTPSKGVRLKRLRSPFVILKPIFGVPIPIATRRGLLCAVAAVVLCSLFIWKVWLAATLSVAVGLFAQVIGAAIYRAEKYLKDALGG